MRSILQCMSKNATARIVSSSIFFILATTSIAKAGELTTSESIVGYARQSITPLLGKNLRLVPGTIQISAKQPMAIDIGGAFRSLIGAEKEEYRVTFKVSATIENEHRKVDVFATGDIEMVIEAAESNEIDPQKDNNTTFRGVDPGTGRLIKVQLYHFARGHAPISLKDLRLTRVN